MCYSRGPRIDKLLQYALYAFYVFYLPCIFLARERWKKNIFTDSGTGRNAAVQLCIFHGLCDHSVDVVLKRE